MDKKTNENKLTNAEIQILLNQREILRALNILLIPKCKWMLLDCNGETRCANALIHRYHETEQLLGIEWGQEISFQAEYPKQKKRKR